MASVTSGSLSAPSVTKRSGYELSMKGRLIAIGDIHGCLQEFSELLEKLDLVGDDRLILIGDLVNRGPDSAGVIDLALRLRARSLLGNHEWRLVRYRRSGNPGILKAGDRETCAALRPEHWSYIEQMPLTIEEPALDMVFVHGGFLPSQPWRKQTADVVTRIQVIDHDGRPAKRADLPGAPAWADFWSGPPFVVYGHMPRSEVYQLKWSIGIDTGCVYGGQLTALVLPERRFVQVKARRRYWP